MNSIKLAILILFNCTTVFSQTIYVNGSLPTNGDGTSWATAFNNLDDAIAASNLPTNEIWVAKGTYFPAKDHTGNPNPAENRNKTFFINKNIKLFGGFSGNELNISERIIGDNPTILSGDLGILDSYTDNSYHVITFTVYSLGITIIDGLIIQKGNASYNVNFGYDSYYYSYNKGGGISIETYSSYFKITNCIFNDNQANYGGAIYMRGVGDDSNITNCVFNNNKAIRGGAIFNMTEGYLNSNINNSTFFNNEATGIYGSGNAICHLIDPSYPSQQGGYCHINNTIFKDSNNGKEEITLLGWGEVLAIFGNELYYYLNNCISIVDIKTREYDFDPKEKIFTTNFLITNPLFINESNPIGLDNKWGTADDGLRLKPCSSAINAGNNSSLPADITTDIAGESRIQLGTVDLGAYESNSNTLPTMAMENTTVTANQAGTTLYYSDCDKLIAKVVSPTASPGVIPIAGSTTAKVWLEPNTIFYGGTPLVSKHYEITPNINSANVEGNVVLYFSQEDFDEYNNNKNGLFSTTLPNHPDDNFNKINLQIMKFPNKSIDGTGLPNSYTGYPSFIETQINTNWNYNESRWEIEFKSTGFSGFFVFSRSNLPLNLISFSANQKNEATELTWKTANEVNTKSFEIERSEEGTKFTKIGTVATKNSLETHEYIFLDNQIEYSNANILYYRLKMMDLDGKFTYSRIVVVSLENNKSISISPNPTSGKAILKLGSKIELLNTMATITNVSGLAIKQFKINKLIEEIDLSDLPKAVYMVKLVDGSVLKLIKE